MNPRRLLIACFVLVLSLPAFAADDRGLYVNAKWGDSDTDASIEDVFDRPTRSLSLFGKIGVFALEGDVEAILDNRTEFLEDASEEDIIYGAGLLLSLIGRLSIFYELEYLGSNIESQYLGASFQF